VPTSTTIRARAKRVCIGTLLLVSTACAGRVSPRGTPPPVRPAAVPFTATAYCTGRVTAAGTSVAPGVAAADPAVLPMGTVIAITGAGQYDGSYSVLDTGSRVRNRHVDLFMRDCRAARRFGRRTVRVTILQKAE
jgi:3D (Asp-Asp-Asp) domain-containing protein